VAALGLELDRAFDYHCKWEIPVFGKDSQPGGGNWETAETFSAFLTVCQCLQAKCKHGVRSPQPRQTPATPSGPAFCVCPAATFKYAAKFYLRFDAPLKGTQNPAPRYHRHMAVAGTDFMLYNFRYPNGKQRLALCHAT